MLAHQRVPNSMYSRDDFFQMVFSTLLLCTLPNLLTFAKHLEILKQLYISEILN